VLRLLNEITYGLHCHPALGLALAIGSFFLQTTLFSFRCFSALAASLAALPCTQAHSYEQTYCSARTG
jgi:hypothetical protein